MILRTQRDKGKPPTLNRCVFSLNVAAQRAIYGMAVDNGGRTNYVSTKSPWLKAKTRLEVIYLLLRIIAVALAITTAIGVIHLAG